MEAITWFKVDDGFWSHEKVIELSPEAGWLWTRAGSYCAHQLTDGDVSAPILTLLGSTPDAADELVSAGLWDRAGKGYRFHDWAEYQPTRAEIEAKRESWKERQRKARASRGDTSRDSERESTSPVPSRPVPSSTKKKPLSASRGSRLDPSWLPSKEDVAKIRSECPGIDPQQEHAEFVDYWIGVPGVRGVKLDWAATWRNWMRRKQRDLKGGKVSPADRARRTVMLATDLLEVES